MTAKISRRADPEVCARIRRRREEAGVSLIDVASRLGVSAVCVSKWERGVNQPSQAAMPIMAEMYHCRVRDFFEDATPAEVVG